MLLFFDTTLVSFTDNFRITILNIILFIGIYIFARFARVYAGKIVKTRFKVQQIKVGDKEFTILQLVKQIINILAIILAIQSLTINNEFKGLKDILEFKLFSVNDFHISVYNILLVFILYFAARLIGTILRLFIQRNLSQKGWIDEGKQYTVIVIAQYIIYFIFILVGIRSFGIDLTALMVSSAGLLLGLGLGLQKFFADIISGFIILFEGTIKVGDIIEVDKIVAKVVEINIRTSKIKTRDGNYIIMPNSKITAENVYNWSFNKKSTRSQINITVSHGNDVEKIRRILYDCALDHKQINPKKPVIVLFDDIGLYGLTFALTFWSHHSWDIPRIKSDIRFSVYKQLKESGVTLPFEKDKIYNLGGSNPVSTNATE
jgi:small-conductance mechanosensitive channel